MIKPVSFFEKLLVFLYFLLLPSQTSYHFWIADSILFGRKIDYLSPTIYLTQIISASLLLYWLYQNVTSKTSIRLKFTPIYFLISLLIFFGCVTAHVPFIAFYRLITILLTGIFFLFLRRRYIFTSPAILFPLSLSLIWSSLLAWLQWFNQSSIGGLFQLLGERPLSLSLVTTAKVSLFNAGLILRSYATFPHPNALAGYLLVIAPFLLLGLKKTTHRFVYRVLLFSFLLSLFTIPLTFSRTSFYALLTLPIVYMWSISHKTLLSKKFITIILICLTIGSLFIPGNPASIPERFLQYSHAYTITISHPILGVGLGNYLYYSPSTLLQLAHNFWLLFLVELGWPITIYMFYQIYNLFRSSILNKSTSLILIWPLLITSLTDTYWLTLNQTTSAALFILVYLYSLSKSSSKIY
jgi:hypothetical protein